MITKKFKIPIYFGTLFVHLTSDMKEFEKKYGLKSLEFTDARAFYKEKDASFHIVFLDKKEGIRLGTLAHESLHVTNFIFREIGYSVDVENDEAQAYLLGWVVDKCYKTLFS